MIYIGQLSGKDLEEIKLRWMKEHSTFYGQPHGRRFVICADGIPRPCGYSEFSEDACGFRWVRSSGTVVEIYTNDWDNIISVNTGVESPIFPLIRIAGERPSVSEFLVSEGLVFLIQGGNPYYYKTMRPHWPPWVWSGNIGELDEGCADMVCYCGTHGSHECERSCFNCQYLGSCEGAENRDRHGILNL